MKRGGGKGGGGGRGMDRRAITLGNEREPLVPKQKGYALECFRVILQDGGPKDAQHGGHIFLPLYVALDDGLYPVLQHLVHYGHIVDEAGAIPSSPGGYPQGFSPPKGPEEAQRVMWPNFKKEAKFGIWC